MKNREKEVIVINKDSLKNYKQLSLGLENCENFDIDISDVLDISCEAYKYSGDNRYGNNYHADHGYIKLSSRAKDLLSDFAPAYYQNKNDYDADDFKLSKRMTMCNDMCMFSLLDVHDRLIDVYVPYNALEEVVHRSEIDYANCPSFGIAENGDMEIRFGKLSKNPFIPRNNYCELVEEWRETFGDFNPKTLKLKVNNYEIDYINDDGWCAVAVMGTVLNKKSEGENILLFFKDCDMVRIIAEQKSKKTRVLMSRLCNGKIYVGFSPFLSVSCSSCSVRIYDDYDD